MTNSAECLKAPLHQIKVATYMWGQDRLRAGCQEVGKCSTRGGSRGTYITFASAIQIRQPTLALKHRDDATINPKQGYQWPQHVSAKNIFKKKVAFDWLPTGLRLAPDWENAVGLHWFCMLPSTPVFESEAS